MLGNAELGSEGGNNLPLKTKSGASRMDLLTLDQRNSSKDIFISISGLIGVCSQHITWLLYCPCTHPVSNPPCRSRKDHSGYQTGREDGPACVPWACDRQCVLDRLLHGSCTVQLSSSGQGWDVVGRVSHTQSIGSLSVSMQLLQWRSLPVASMGCMKLTGKQPLHCLSEAML